MEFNVTFLLQLGIFLILLTVLSNVLWEPLLKLMDERERRIEGAAGEAKQLRAKAEAAAGTIEARMAEATADARKVLNDLREKGRKVELDLIESARSEAQTKLEDARADLFAATEDARGQLKDDANRLAADVVGKVLGRAA
jgi:F-type H+-transporting ATPase subunit b